MGCGIARFGRRSLKTTETWKFWSQNLSPGVSRHSNMGFRGAAEGFRGTATWGFEGQQHGTWRHSNKWDGTSRGSRGTSRHSNMGQGYRGDIFLYFSATDFKSQSVWWRTLWCLPSSADRRSPFPLEWRGVRNKQFLDKETFQWWGFSNFLSSFTSTVQFNSAWRHVKKATLIQCWSKLEGKPRGRKGKLRGGEVK